MMISDHKNIAGIILLMVFCGFFSVKAQNVEVVIEGIRSSKGQIIIGIYEDEQRFREDKPYIRKKYKKTDISEGKMTIYLNLDPGTYGFALLDDENNDEVMNYNLIGIPKEGFGFSNYYHTSLTSPKFDLFSFVLSENENKKILCKIRYVNKTK
jgi:uncharacterized protein (DUF2141 family)